MERRIFGLENEYGVTCTLRGQRRLSPDEVARYLFRRVVSWGRSSNVFLANGARLYLDVGSHPEYATPECDSILDLVTHDKAGERILEQLLVAASQLLRDEVIRGNVYMFKNNTDSAHPRDQPRPDDEAPGAAGERAGRVGARHSVRVPGASAALRRDPRPFAGGGPGAADVGALPDPAGRRPAVARPRGRLGDQAQADRVVQRPARAAAVGPAGGADRPAVPRHRPAPEPLLQDAGARAGRAGDQRRGDRRGRRGPTPDHQGSPAGRVHPPCQGTQARLHRRLGPPEAQRPGAAHGPLQGPLPLARRAGRPPDRQPLAGLPRPEGPGRRCRRYFGVAGPAPSDTHR